MKKGMILGLLGLAFIAGLGLADDLVPIAVSPGGPDRTVVVRESCPTFSWTAVSWALTYKVVVFEAAGEEVPTYENMVAAASPVLVKEIPGQALSWTPSADESLSNGGSYFWYVGAMNNAAQGSWSEGRSFLVVEEPVRDLETEKRAMKTMRENGIGDDVAEKVLHDMNMEPTEKPVSNFDLKSDSGSEVQGSEGATNTFYGKDAGAVTTGMNNSFFGRAAGYTNTTGANNTFMGYLSGYANTTGSNNTFMGYLSGRNTTGSNNTFMGNLAGRYNTTGENNTFLGAGAGYTNTTGVNNTFMGYLSGTFNTTGSQNTFIGWWAGKNNTAGYQNTFIGDEAGPSNTTGYENTFLGCATGNANTTGFWNTFLGNFAGFKNTSGSYNVFLGHGAGSSNTTGNDNIFIGDGAGEANTTANENIIIGVLAGYKNTTGYQNIFLGSEAGQANTTGYENTFIGTSAGISNTSGSGNDFLGWSAGAANTTGYSNTFLGRRAGTFNTTGYENVFIGRGTGFFNATGYKNTYVGRGAGTSNTTGMGNVFLGYYAGYNETASNRLYIANSETTTPLIWGNFNQAQLQFNGKVGIQTGAVPTHLLDVGASGAYCDGGVWHDGSSREYKENIEGLTLSEAQQAFEKLEPVKFQYKDNRGETYLGFIAEDVPDLVATNDRKSLAPMDMVAVLTKVVQEQQKAISELRDKITKLESVLPIEK